MKTLKLFLSFCLIMFLLVTSMVTLSSCGVTTSYIGKSYAPTNNVDVFVDWKDIPRNYESMGYIDATPQSFSSIQKAQEEIEKIAKQKGADAIILGGVEVTHVNPSVQTTEDIQKKESGGYTKISTTTHTANSLQTLKATFIKYK